MRNSRVTKVSKTKKEIPSPLSISKKECQITYKKFLYNSLDNWNCPNLSMFFPRHLVPPLAWTRCIKFWAYTNPLVTHQSEKRVTLSLFASKRQFSVVTREDILSGNACPQNKHIFVLCAECLFICPFLASPVRLQSDTVIDKLSVFKMGYVFKNSAPFPFCFLSAK